MPNVSADALGRGTQSANSIGNPKVNFPRVSLSRNGIGGGESGFLAENLRHIRYRDGYFEPSINMRSPR